MTNLKTFNVRNRPLHTHTHTHKTLTITVTWQWHRHSVLKGSRPCSCFREVRDPSSKIHIYTHIYIS